MGEWTNRLYDYFEHAQTIGLKEFLHKLPNLDANILAQMDCPSADSQSREGNRFSADHLKAIQNAFTSLSKRTMILPIPPDCDKNGCRGKARKGKTSGTLAPRELTETSIDIEMRQMTPNNNNPEKPTDERTMSLSKAYGDLSKGQTESCTVSLQPLKIHLDGPYGAPSSNIFQTEHAFLIATGIGVTPFASILQSIIYRNTEKKT